MQAVLDFLLEYFYWILGVLVVLLITVIGFLADTKRKQQLRAKNNNQGNGVSNNENFLKITVILFYTYQIGQKWRKMFMLMMVML